MRILLAPMEGVIDHTMRELLTRIGGYDRCVTEFIRVTTHPVPAKVFRRFAPELETGGRTESGVPVYVQLLGGNPERMARSAVHAVAAGAPGIDLNFGCPAKVVNRHDGGSVLLREPERVGDIVSAVRDAVDSSIPVCAKIRLGFDDVSLLEAVANRIADAGASELCIHARTRADGYRPPAHWHEVRRLQGSVAMPLVVNGEIWKPGHATAALADSGCEHLMLGRGALARPDLARAIRAATEPSGAPWKPMPWVEVAQQVQTFFQHQDSSIRRYVGNRTKQWLGYLRKQYPEAELLFQAVKRSTDVGEITKLIDRSTRGALEEFASAA